MPQDKLARARKLLTEAIELLESIDEPTPREIVEPMPLMAASEMGFTRTMDVGYSWFLQLKGGVAPAMLSWQREYSWIGTRSALERATVADSLRRDPWATANAKRVTPAHIVRYWMDYTHGPRGTGALDPEARKKAAELDKQRRRDELRLRYVKLKSAAPDGHAREMLEHEYLEKRNRLESLLGADR